MNAATILVAFLRVLRSWSWDVEVEVELEVVEMELEVEEIILIGTTVKRLYRAFLFFA